ncbi:MAG: hypothetical protein R3Y24_08380 [Eubacteriales bacterium]
MKKVFLKAAIFLLVFISTLFISSFLMNTGNTDMTSELSDASIPIVYMLQNNDRINTLHGYAESMDLEYMRESVTPIGMDRKVSFQIEYNVEDVVKVSYEVRDVMGERLIENGDIFDAVTGTETITAIITLKDLIQVGEEYNFIVLLSLENGQTIEYYTRIILEDTYYVDEKIAYVLDFHEKTFSDDEEEAKEIVKYLESNSEGDNTTFHKVNIHSSFSQVTWGDLDVKKVTEAVPLITDITSSYGTIQLTYMVSMGSGKNITYYHVEENYRVRYTTDRMYLLDYERTMSEIFKGEKEDFVNGKIVLGIADESISLVESEGGNIFAFINNNRLYTYNGVDNKLANVYSFYDLEDFDIRTTYDKMDMKIMSVEENGNIMFLIYGYMNRGRYEGQVGLQVMYYSALANTVEEQIFIPYTKAADILIYDVNTLAYINTNYHLFVIIDGSIYDVDMVNKSYEIVYEDIAEGSIQISASNDMVVWQEGNDEYHSDSLIWFNLATNQKVEMKANAGESLMPLGFMEEDLIYGIANEEDITLDTTGNIIYPMKNIIIQSETGNILKNYTKENIYTVGCQIEENQIILQRIEKLEDGYLDIEEDQITNNQEIKTGVNYISTVTIDYYEKIVQIILEKEMDSDDLIVSTPKEILYEGNREVALENEASPQRYYLYHLNGILEINSDANEIIQMAYENSGAVFDDVGECIWRYGLNQSVNQIMALDESYFQEDVSSLEVCLDAILQFSGGVINVEEALLEGKTSYEILEEGLGYSAQVYDLTGCSLGSVLYYIDHEMPVLAQLQDGEALLVVGYNTQNVVLMRPEEGKVYKMGMNDATALFEENGNHFISYMK